MTDKIPADLAFWDEQELLTTNEIAWLWCGLEPPKQGRMYWSGEGLPGRPPDPPLSRAEIIVHAILSANKDPSDPLKQVDSHSEKINGTIAFRRADLRAWAERQGFKPLFLFPELRPENQTGLSLEGALQVIAALARAVNSRWNPGQTAPYGMVKGLTEVAANLNLRLDRNTIGKYLKVAGNKNISA